MSEATPQAVEFKAKLIELESKFLGKELNRSEYLGGLMRVYEEHVFPCSRESYDELSKVWKEHGIGTFTGSTSLCRYSHIRQTMTNAGTPTQNN